jgi:hypothetical protein
VAQEASSDAPGSRPSTVLATRANWIDSEEGSSDDSSSSSADDRGEKTKKPQSQLPATEDDNIPTSSEEDDEPIAAVLQRKYEAAQAPLATTRLAYSLENELGITSPGLGDFGFDGAEKKSPKEDGSDSGSSDDVGPQPMKRTQLLGSGETGKGHVGAVDRDDEEGSDDVPLAALMTQRLPRLDGHPAGGYEGHHHMSTLPPNGMLPPGMDAHLAYADPQAAMMKAMQQQQQHAQFMLSMQHDAAVMAQGLGYPQAWPMPAPGMGMDMSGMGMGMPGAVHVDPSLLAWGGEEGQHMPAPMAMPNERLLSSVDRWRREVVDGIDV